MTASFIRQLKQTNPTKYQQWLNGNSAETLNALRYDWLFWARDNQLIPDALLTNPNINTWLIIAGRGYGKTRTGAESTKWLVENMGYRHIGLVGRTAADIRDTMVKGVSGLLSIYPDKSKPIYTPSTRSLLFPNKASAITYSADEPDQLRGANTDLVWGDELAAWQYLDAYDQINFGNRIGTKPIQIYTTTPRSIPLIKEMMQAPNVVITHGVTFENIDNLAPAAVAYLMRKYQGTTLGKQELYAEILEDVSGALWRRSTIDNNRVTHADQLPKWSRVIVALDPSAKSKTDSDETGMSVCALGKDDLGYVLADETLRGTPDEWARKAVELFYRYNAEMIVAEDNQGGEMIEYTIRTIDKFIPIKRIPATISKRLRAAPIAALYEQGRVKHFGYFMQLEDQMVSWVEDDKQSPDRMDAMVHGMRELFITGGSSWQTARVGKAMDTEEKDLRRRLGIRK